MDPSNNCLEELDIYICLLVPKTRLAGDPVAPLLWTTQTLPHCNCTADTSVVFHPSPTTPRESANVGLARSDCLLNGKLHATHMNHQDINLIFFPMSSLPSIGSLSYQTKTPSAPTLKLEIYFCQLTTSGQQLDCDHIRLPVTSQRLSTYTVTINTCFTLAGCHIWLMLFPLFMPICSIQKPTCGSINWRRRRVSPSLALLSPTGSSSQSRKSYIENLLGSRGLAIQYVTESMKEG